MKIFALVLIFIFASACGSITAVSVDGASPDSVEPNSKGDRVASPNFDARLPDAFADKTPGGSGGIVASTGGTVMASGGTTGSGGAPGTGGSMPQFDACRREYLEIETNFPCDGSCLKISNAIDGDFSTRFTTGFRQGLISEGEQVTLKFKRLVSLSGIRLMTQVQTDAPAAYRLEYSIDTVTFQSFVPMLVGPGSADLMINFSPTKLRSIRIVQTGSKLDWWSISELITIGCSIAD